jgi:Protein of unknown function (DUF3810)
MVIKEKIKNLWTNWHWTLLGLAALLLRFVADSTPQYVEQFYSRGVFLGVRWLFDWTLAWLPFPLLLVFYGVALFYVYKFVKSLFAKQIPFRKRLAASGRNLLNFAGFGVFSFLMLWGYNYARPNFSKQLGITIEQPDALALRQELEIAAKEAIDARKTIENAPLSINYVSSDIEDKMRADVSDFLEKNNFKAGGRLRGRQISPDGVLFRFGISGIYMPFTGESSIDRALHPLEKPFTMAHELAHGYGWTEEATANFVAYLACLNSSDNFTRYSGLISYYRYVASNYKRSNPVEYAAFRAQLPEGFRNDLEAINQRLNQYPTWFSTDKLNDIFLKSQGVTEGLASYSRIVVLVYSWRKQPQ